MFSKWNDSSWQTSGWAGISPDTHEWKAEVKETWSSTLWDISYGQCQGRGAPWYLLVPISKRIRKLVRRKKFQYFWNPIMNKTESWISFRSTFYVQCLTYNWSILLNKHLFGGKWRRYVISHTALWLKTLKLEKRAFLCQMLMWTDEILDIFSWWVKRQ